MPTETIELDIRGQVCPSCLLLTLREINRHHAALCAGRARLVVLLDSRDATGTIPEAVKNMGLSGPGRQACRLLPGCHRTPGGSSCEPSRRTRRQAPNSNGCEPRTSACRRSTVKAFDYIRAKVNELLEVVGTRHAAPGRARRPQPARLRPDRHRRRPPSGTCSKTCATPTASCRWRTSEIRAIFDTVGSALLVVDPQRRVVSFNQQASRLLLGHDGEVLGQYCNQLLCAMPIRRRSNASSCRS